MLSNDQEVCERLNRVARIIGKALGIDLGVDESGDKLVFVDENADPISIDGDEIIAATMEEVRDKTYLGEFGARALRAASIAKLQEIERSRTP